MDMHLLRIFSKDLGTYHTDLPTPDDIRRFLQLNRVELKRTIKSQNVVLTPNQILIKELSQDMKFCIRNLFCDNLFGEQVGHRDYLSASLAHMLHLQVEELKSVNKSLNLSVEELSKARALAEATLRERDEMICAKCEKMRLLEEQSEYFMSLNVEIKSLQTENKVLKSREFELNNLEKVYETKESVLLKDIDQINSQVSNFLEKLSSSVQKEYNDLLASNDVLKQRLETKFTFSKHDTSLEKMIEMIEKEYESNVSKITITSSMFETKNLKLVKEMGDKVKCFDEEKKAFETKISKLEKVLAQRVKDFDDVKTELSKRTHKFETYFENLKKQNALLKS
ncbi:hypothetical protein Tco_0910378 [Tanacetum coccineum]|uniref:Uncharacterized protein n=1 Tax=Tanacetum coccineum TaxID=301880 RepID=A0ABQ5CVX5_9ASTR